MKLLIALAVVALSALVAAQEYPEKKEAVDDLFVFNADAAVQEKYNDNANDDDDNSGDRQRRSAGLARGLFRSRSHSRSNGGYHSGYGAVRNAAVDAFAGRGFSRVQNALGVAPSSGVFASRFADRVVPARFGASVLSPAYDAGYEGFGARGLSAGVLSSSRVSAFDVPSAARVSAFGVRRDDRVYPFGVRSADHVSAFDVPSFPFGVRRADRVSAFDVPSAARVSAFGVRSADRLSAFDVPSSPFGVRSADRLSAFDVPSSPFGVRSAGRLSAFDVPSAARVSAFGVHNTDRFSAFDVPSTARVSTFGVRRAGRVPAFDVPSTARVSVFGVRSADRVSPFDVPSSPFGVRSADRLSAFDVPSAARVSAFGVRRADGVSAFDVPYAARVSAFGVRNADRESAFGVRSADRVSAFEVPSAAARLSTYDVPSSVFTVPSAARVSAFGVRRDDRVSAFDVPNYYQVAPVVADIDDSVHGGFRVAAAEPSNDADDYPFSFVRFFRSFTPQTAVVTEDNVYVRSYVRDTSAVSFDDCLSDFNRLRLSPVKAISSETALSSEDFGLLSDVRVARPALGLFSSGEDAAVVQGEATVGYFGVMRHGDRPYRVYAIRQGCAVDGYSGYHDCIIFSGDATSYPYAKTVRRFVYVNRQETATATATVSDYPVNSEVDRVIANRYGAGSIVGAGYRVNNNLW